MTERPTGAELLAIAEQQPTEELVAGPAEARRYRARLLAAATAIAEREHEAAGAPARNEHARIEALVGKNGELDALRWRLAEAIRGGAFDAAGPERDRLLAHLWATTRARLAISNPKHLKANDPK